MKKFILFAAMSFSLFSLFAIDFVPNELIIKTKKNITINNQILSEKSLQNNLQKSGIVNIKSLNSKNKDRYFVLSVDYNKSLLQSKSLLEKDKNIEFVQYNYINHLYSTPNDSLWANQLISANAVKLPDAWNYSTGSKQILIGIVDSGLLLTHPDLQNNRYINKNEIPDNNIDDDNNGYIDDVYGWDFVDAPNMADMALGDFTDRDNNPNDENFHGTHVAGIIGADSNNNKGIAGINWNCSILPLRAGFRTNQGQGYLEDDDCAAAIIYAADMGCQVINMSWGDRNYSPIIEDACNYAYSKGCILVASAGNDPEPVISYPAKLASVIAVGAVDENKQLASFSSYGPDLDIMAPGQNIMSCYSPNNPYFVQNGTSMSAPFVTGAIALLLSQEGNLSLEDVKTRLYVSAQDLGEPGFDNLYGAGLLDVQKLISSHQTYNIEVTYPLDRQFVSSDFDIIGSVQSSNFFRYSVMYSSVDEPGANDWKDVNTHLPTPNYFYIQKSNEVLANFHFVPLFPDGNYRLRIQIESKDGKLSTSISRFIVDRKAPQLMANSLFMQSRWSENKLRHFILFATDERVQADLKVKINNQIHELFSNVPDSVFSFKLPELPVSGEINVMISIKDLAGHTFNSNWINNLGFYKNDETSNYDYSEQKIGTPYLFARNTCDFDSNQSDELIAMEIDDNANGTVRALEYFNGTFVNKHTFNEKFNPLYIAHKNSNEIDLFALKLAKLEVYSAFGINDYPDIPIWNLDDVNGAISGDIDNNGQEEMIAIRNLADQSAIEIYQKNNIEYIKTATINNLSATTVRRMFVPKLALGDLDNDGKNDLLTADIDGDVMIYEWNTIENKPVLSWSKRLPVLNAYYLSIADYDGDNQKEFCAGGYVKDNDPDKSFWHFEWYKSAADNQYTKIGEINFSNVVTGQSSISEADIDNDGKAELVASTTPNVYVIKFKDGLFKPVWYSNSDKTFQIIAVNSSVNAPGGFFINKTVNDTTCSYFVSKNTVFNGPETPKSLIARVAEDNSVTITWNRLNVDSYNIYKKTGLNGIPELISNTSDTLCTDLNLQLNTDYYYAVTSLDNDYSPNESHFSTWIKVNLNAQIIVSQAQMISNKQIKITFNHKLSPLSANRGFFKATINNLELFPSSVSLLADNKIILLHFSNALNPTSDFILNCTNLTSWENNPVPDLSVNVSMVTDLIPPYVKETSKYTSNIIKLHLSELPDLNHVINEENFAVESPIQGNDYSITNVSVQDSVIYLTLDHDLQNSIKPYWIKCFEIYDLAGNKMLNNQNRYCLNLTEISNLSFMEVYPNPLKTKDFNQVTFTNLPENKSGELKIYNLNGELVYKQKISNQSELFWKAVNNDGHQVSSGLYHYIVKIGNDLKKGKIVVIN